MPCILNAANEVAVHAFLTGRIGFLRMSQVIEKTMDTVPLQRESTLEEYIETDARARAVAKSFI